MGSKPIRPTSFFLMKLGDIICSNKNKSVRAVVLGIQGQYIHARMEEGGDVQTFHRDFVHVVSSKNSFKTKKHTVHFSTPIGPYPPGVTEGWFKQKWESLGRPNVHSMWSTGTTEQFQEFCKFFKSVAPLT